MVDEALKVKANTWHELGRGLALPDALERLRRIQVPTLVFWGNRDTLLTRADQDELIANIPNSRLVVYPNTGHALHWEQPERFARDLVEFMEH
jgi:pimeloyl-ACP methyl ester carboxylesterase